MTGADYWDRPVTKSQVVLILAFLFWTVMGGLLLFSIDIAAYDMVRGSLLRGEGAAWKAGAVEGTAERRGTLVTPISSVDYVQTRDQTAYTELKILHTRTRWGVVIPAYLLGYAVLLGCHFSWKWLRRT